MRCPLSYAIAASLAIPLCAPAAGDEPEVDVYLPAAWTPAMHSVLYRARAVVTEIYSGMGIRVAWKAAGASPGGCSVGPSHASIIVNEQFSTTQGISREALAFSSPYSRAGPCITLLMNRLRPAVESNPLSAGFLLGHVLAHEIGHVLEGSDGHSEGGLMKSRWSPHEMATMPLERLRFSARDTRAILNALGGRAAPHTPLR
jgi:hypothetical protein